jgi:HEAT repeat protein
MSSARELVQRFGVKSREVEALRGLTGGVSATHLRAVVLSDEVFAALVEGLGDPHPRVRWWCIQVLDHVPDPRAIAAIAPLMDDPVPRVRRVAAHALGCVACKPEWRGALPDAVTAKLVELAAADENLKVRRGAAWALVCRAGSAQRAEVQPSPLLL